MGRGMRHLVLALTAAFAATGCTDKRCSTNADCDDGLYCNGQSSCFLNRCTVATLPDCDDGLACTVDRCSEEIVSCVHTPVDADRDGYGDAKCLDAIGVPLGIDCADDDANRFPGNREVCDTHDEDCDPVTLGGKDTDRDGFVDMACTNPGPDGGTITGTDCNDNNEGVHRGQLEACNGFDDNCNGMADEGVTSLRYHDDDGDGWGAGTASQGCFDDPGTSANDDDCDDTNPAMHPGQMRCVNSTQYQLCQADGGFGLAQTCVQSACRPQPTGLGLCL